MVTGPGRRTREEIAKWNQMTIPKFQTRGRTSDIPSLPSGEIRVKRERLPVDIKHPVNCEDHIRMKPKSSNHKLKSAWFTVHDSMCLKIQSKSNTTFLTSKQLEEKKLWWLTIQKNLLLQLFYYTCQGSFQVD